MAAFDVTGAMDFVGQTVLAEIGFSDDPQPFWACLRVAGVVFAQHGYCDDPHFLVYRAFSPERHPFELFWSDIRTLLPLNR